MIIIFKYYKQLLLSLSNSLINQLISLVRMSENCSKSESEVLKLFVLFDQQNPKILKEGDQRMFERAFAS